MLAQKGKLTCASFPPWWDVVVQDERMLVQEGNIEPMVG
jgi:hypothetical protein